MRSEATTSSVILPYEAKQTAERSTPILKIGANVSSSTESRFAGDGHSEGDRASHVWGWGGREVGVNNT